MTDRSLELDVRALWSAVYVQTHAAMLAKGVIDPDFFARAQADHAEDIFRKRFRPLEAA